MPSWRIDLSVSVNIDSSAILAFPFFSQNYNPKGLHDVASERDWLEGNLLTHHLDQLLQWDIASRASSLVWHMDGAVLESGADGELIQPSTFKSVTGAFSSIHVGCVIHIHDGPARGHYPITAVISPTELVLDGIVPGAYTALDFEIHYKADVSAVLVSDP